ncbi:MULTISPECIES: acetyltransferase [Helicobacter]|uniref:Acetyltransferase n=1 Tax=Helicobacter ibis TaxID=2962633 RepID=A0ABT4VHK5_9HELI|nr:MULTISPECIES: acetyltransferase [Helicobacter]MDA3967942.1 acetyltransferase [Helicobacter sp. WB40]MDA3969610.1 acetyltransferase [Helicobacter ibis]
MDKFAIFGASGHGRVIFDMIVSNGFIVKYIIDDNPQNKTISKIPAISREEFLSLKDTSICIALGVGDNFLRKNLYKFFSKMGFSLPSIIHKSAIISPSAIINEACVVMPNVVVNANALVKRGAILNTSCVLEHDCIVGEFSHLSPNSTLCGAVKVGNLSHIGAGTTIIPTKSVGDNCVVGAGSVVISDIKSNTKIVGNPAKKELR